MTESVDEESGPMEGEVPREQVETLMARRHGQMHSVYGWPGAIVEGSSGLVGNPR